MSRFMKVGLVVSALVACGRGNSGLNPSHLPAAVLAAPAPAIFSDDFESASLAEWQDGLDPARHRIVSGPGRAQSGSHYLSVTYPAGRDGGWLTRFFMPGYDSMYVSLHVRFPKDWVGGTKIVGLYGSRTDDQWSAFGKAGICPNGTDFLNAMLITLDTGNPGPMKFYTYYPAMARDPDGKTCWGRYTDRAGQAAAYAPPSLTGLSPDTWHQIEFEVKLNRPGESGGSQTFWIDGREGARWSGISFRDSTVLRLNAVQLSFSSGAVGVASSQQLDVDNLVVREAR